MNNKAKRAEAEAEREDRSLLCDKLSFAASEAYKLVRSNLTFSLVDNESCRVIGVTSSVRSEGKSTTSINLSYTLAETGKRVLTIDGDMRLPSINKRLKLHRAPGLSNLLAGMSTINEAVQPSGISRNWYVITAGDIPPNPSELLGSGRLVKLLEVLRKNFDYVILDLPPITIVSDALVVAQHTDGMLMVVRQNYTNQMELAESMRQMSYQKVKLLGFVQTHATTQYKRYGSRYGHYGKYGKYGYGYGYGYGKSKSSGSDASFALGEEKESGDR